MTNKIPVHLIEADDQKLPEEGMFYALGSNGPHLGVDSPWVKALVPIKTLGTLKKVEPFVQLKLPPIPKQIIAYTLAFFQKVMNEHDAEAAVLLHYGKEKGWNLSIPKQEVSSGNVEYDMTERIEGMRCVGTIHSHVRMSAFHSGTDITDEKNFDGVHITMGMIDRLPYFDMDAEVLVRGYRAKLNHTYLEGVDTVDDDPTVKNAWSQKAKYRFGYKLKSVYDKIPASWMKKVTPRKYTTYSTGYWDHKERKWVPHKKDDDKKDLKDDFDWGGYGY